MKKWQKEMAGFTLVETLIVLLILSILILIMIPNLMQHKDFAEKKSDEALVHVVESQMTMYELEKATNKKPSLEELESADFITKDQKEKYERIMKKEQ
ncbi:MAG: prepilin-type N-terminal cleavage/methylation domain-containing protein [Streptococcaceae bacterium]|jgi:competence protein ComGC|nr:prepilin-type N-terminal cleavage/methylation domain-containing protein [Streptococcaceae bacterium]